MASRFEEQLNAMDWNEQEAYSKAFLAHERAERYRELQPHLALRSLRKSLRDDNGVKLSQTRMAEILGVSLRGYQNYEQGERSIPSNILTKLKAHFNISADALLTNRFVGQDYESMDTLIDEAVSLTFYFVAEFKGLKPSDLRLVVKRALGEREQMRVWYQDPTLDFAYADFAQYVKEETNFFDGPDEPQAKSNRSNSVSP